MQSGQITRSAESSFPVPLQMVDSSKFGRWPKISDEYTYNLFVADDALLNFAGYQYVLSLLGNGRGIFSSKKAGAMFAVSEKTIFSINTSFIKSIVGTLTTTTEDVYIDEDIINNIAFVDGSNIYIYNYVTGNFYIPGTNPYSGGTSAAQSGNTVTGVGTTFTSAMVGGNIYWPNDTFATITGFTNATTLTVNTSETIVAGAYLITEPLDFTPAYVFFHDGRFVVPSNQAGGNQISQWRLSNPILVTGATTSIITFPNTQQFVGGFQTKPDLPVAGSRLPGRGQNIFIMGSEVTEPWVDLGLAKFPYQKQTSFNLDFGCINASTVSTLNNLVVWLGGNERTGPVIMYTTGQDVKKISTDGIDFLFERLIAPSECYGYTYMQSGHLFYVITFFNPADNITLAYDFNTGKFYNLTDEDLNYFIAKKVVFFNEKYYFISINDGDIYELNSEFTTYEYRTGIEEIPRARILPTYLTQDGVPQVGNDVWFVMEQGVDSQYTGQGNNIASIAVDSGGVDYTECIVLIEGDGSTAHATATIVAGEVTAITVNNPGIAYTWAVVTLIGDGTGAEASALLNVANYVPQVNISVSYDGGYSWSNFDKMTVNTYGKFKNRFYYNGLGYSNEFTLQFRMYMKSRFVCKNGMMSFYR
jgi:hypothetical protein